MEFALYELSKLIEACDHDQFLAACTRYKIAQCLDVVRLEDIRSCSLLGAVLADFFNLLCSLLESSTDHAAVATIGSAQNTTGKYAL